MKMIRHVMTPSISFSGNPDFSSGFFGYYGQERSHVAERLRLNPLVSRSRIEVDRSLHRREKKRKTTNPETTTAKRRISPAEAPCRTATDATRKTATTAPTACTHREAVQVARYVTVHICQLLGIEVV